jgi:hypothetical protein
MKRTRERADAGYGMVELVISSVILGMMIFAVSTLSVRGGEAQEYSRRLSRATEVTQSVLDGARIHLVSSVRLFGNDAEGAANVAVIDLTGLPAQIGGTRLPTIAAGESPRRDTVGNEITGNSLFFAKLAWTDRFTCTSGTTYAVDVYRWCYYYLTPEGGGPSPGSPLGLNIVQWVGEPMADAAGIDRITDPGDHKELLLHLANGTPDASGVSHEPVVVVWRRGALPSVTGTLRQIDASDGDLDDDPHSGRPDPWRVLGEGGGLLSYRHHSVVSVHGRANLGVGRYSVVQTTSPGFPHGFEVQIVGPSSARQIVLRLVVASTHRSGQLAWSNGQVTIDARDL